jgi:hypothetical protein
MKMRDPLRERGKIGADVGRRRSVDLALFARQEA